ncbi:hypothetical protein LTR84_012598 [Exophiala bonariae]|uniref:F-box domain-containing protein n=1 Tax=Exophiala bonariae TaxID=1690606 RepID=A0AAV9NIV8_9EURO|nr:hypothetical protein LTR84_012598 [Exophiala bonariae]
MYQLHQTSPAFDQREYMDIHQRQVDFAVKAAEEADFFRKWTLLWRSITLSSLDDNNCYKPYCRYIKTLDFRNLLMMLEDQKFLGAVRKAFFAGALKPFHFPKKEHNRLAVDTVATVSAIGDAVTAKTTLLEEIAGHISPGFLPRWIARSPKLQSLVLWRGDALANGAGESIAKHCDQFRNLTIHDWQMPDADESFANFLNELPANKLAYFEIISQNTIGKLSFEALGRHKSLQHLDLGSLNQEAVSNLNALKACTELQTLKLDDSYGSVQLESSNNDVFLEVVEWLSSCGQLRDLRLKGLFDGPAILSRVLYSPTVKLTMLSLEGYTVRHTSAQLFHSALSEQQSLEAVWLKGNGEDTTPDDLQIMVEALCNLRNLRELALRDVSDEFQEDHIINLALNLPLLEEFWTSGDAVSREVLGPLAGLKNLKTLTLNAMTEFTMEAIMDFLAKLDPQTQRGFNLNLMAQDPDHDLAEMEQDVIREFIRANLEGRFEFVLWRDADISDSEDD